jgi:hypothetical protein
MVPCHPAPFFLHNFYASVSSLFSGMLELLLFSFCYIPHRPLGGNPAVTDLIYCKGAPRSPLL